MRIALTSSYPTKERTEIQNARKTMEMDQRHNRIHTGKVYSRNWPMRAEWAPFCNFRGPFFKQGGPRKE